MVRSPDPRRFRRVSLGTTLAVLVSATVAAADFPGERWNIDFVRVAGEDQAAVRNGLQRAAEIYFYGDETDARMEATARGDGAFDVRIIGSDGRVLAEQTGLNYAQGGDAAGSVAQAALAWLDGLACADGCAIAQAGPVPAPSPTPEPTPARSEQAVAVAQATVEALRTSPIEEEPVAVELSPVTSEPVEVPAIAVAPTPEIEAPAITVPASPVQADDVQIAAITPEPVRSEGLDADLVLRQERARQAPRADRGASSQPSTGTEITVPTRPAQQEIATPSISAAPSTGSSAGASLAAATPKTQTPVIVTAPEKPEAPQVESESPASETPDESAVATVTAEASPVVETAPVVDESVEASRTVSEAVKEAETSTALSIQQPQEVTPGIALPSPTENGTPSTIAEIATGSSTQPTVETEPAAEVSSIVPAPTPVPTEAPSVAEAASAAREEADATSTQDDGDGEQLALVNPQSEVAPQPTPSETANASTPLAPETDTTPTAPQTDSAGDNATTVETRIAAVDPAAEGPTLANARWVGFTPAVYTGSDNKTGAWISGPFDRKQRTGWITDTATGATTRVTFIWRDGGSGSRTALLSREAASALGLGQGDVANVAVYLPR
ncbi:MAG: hypothetical protein AAFN27_03010 [Pseudomonadota bacterium]